LNDPGRSDDLVLLELLDLDGGEGVIGEEVSSREPCLSSRLAKIWVDTNLLRCELRSDDVGAEVVEGENKEWQASESDDERGRVSTKGIRRQRHSHQALLVQVGVERSSVIQKHVS